MGFLKITPGVIGACDVAVEAVWRNGDEDTKMEGLERVLDGLSYDELRILASSSSARPRLLIGCSESISEVRYGRGLRIADDSIDE